MFQFSGGPVPCGWIWVGDREAVVPGGPPTNTHKAAKLQGPQAQAPKLIFLLCVLG